MTDSTNQGASQSQPASAWSVVDDQRVIRIAGPGTDKFLQGQFSQNLADVTQTFSPRAAACSPKGRAYCLTRLVRDGDDILMVAPDALVDAITSQLRKYLMLFRGTSMDVLENARMLGIFGHQLPRALCPERSDQLDRPGASLALDTHHLVRTEDTAEGQPRYEFWQIGELSEAHSGVLAADHRTPAINWRASEIDSGIAALTPQTQETYVPQMLNWQHVGGVHFKKGCYTGQEVIARMHFLGQLKKSLFRLATEHVTTPLEPGTAIMANEKAVGEVVNSVLLADGTARFLAVIRHDAADQLLHLESSPAITVKRLDLPYPVPEQSKSAQPDT